MKPNMTPETLSKFPQDYQDKVIKYLTVAWYYDLSLFAFSPSSCTFNSGEHNTVTMDLRTIDKLIKKIDPKWLRCYPLETYGFDRYLKVLCPNHEDI